MGFYQQQDLNQIFSDQESEHDKYDGAVFSSDEEQPVAINPIAAEEEPVKPSDTTYHNPLEIIQKEQLEKENLDKKGPVKEYNPVYVVQKFQSGQASHHFDHANQFMMDDYHPHPSEQPIILYNPLTKKTTYDVLRKQRVYAQSGSSLIQSNRQPGSMQELNKATPGSLIRVWSGKLNLQQSSIAKQMTAVEASKLLMSMNLFSTQDIR